MIEEQMKSTPYSDVESTRVAVLAHPASFIA
jgi:hypothetical protein